MVQAHQARLGAIAGQCLSKKLPELTGYRFDSGFGVLEESPSAVFSPRSRSRQGGVLPRRYPELRAGSDVRLYRCRKPRWLSGRGAISAGISTRRSFSALMSSIHISECLDAKVELCRVFPSGLLCGPVCSAYTRHSFLATFLGAVIRLCET